MAIARKTRRRRLFALLLGAASALLLAEGSLRLTDPLWRVFYPPVCFQPEVFRQTPFGYALHPGLDLEHEYPPGSGRSYRLKANSEGFRDTELFDSSGRGIVVLGDSMVFGLGVEARERFTGVLAEALPDHPVFNLGMVGYGVDLMVRAFEQVGSRLAPGVVVLSVFTDDPRRVVAPYAGVGFPLPRFSLEGGRLTTIAYPKPTLLDHLLLFQASRYLLWRYTPATFALNEAVIDHLRKLTSDAGADLILAFLPGPRHGWDDEMRRRWLERYARERGVRFVDATSAFSERADLFLPNDPHYAATGHTVLAAALLDPVREAAKP